MTVNDLFNACVNIDSRTSFSIYDSLEDFENATSRFTTYINKRSVPAAIRNKKISCFELSKHSNTVFIALA